MDSNIYQAPFSFLQKLWISAPGKPAGDVILKWSQRLKSCWQMLLCIRLMLPNVMFFQKFNPWRKGAGGCNVGEKSLISENHHKQNILLEEVDLCKLKISLVFNSSLPNRLLRNEINSQGPSRPSGGSVIFNSSALYNIQHKLHYSISASVPRIT